MKEYKPRDWNRMMDAWEPATSRTGSPWRKGFELLFGMKGDGKEDVRDIEKYLHETFPHPEEGIITTPNVQKYFEDHPGLLAEFLYGPAVIFGLEVKEEHKPVFEAGFALSKIKWTFDLDKNKFVAANIPSPLSDKIAELLSTEYLPQLIEALDWK